jgi:hypothetical protein
MMTKVLEDALRRTKTWPQKDQEELLRFLLDVERRHGSEDVLSDEDWKLIEECMRAARHGNLASDKEVKAVFAKYRSA